MASTNEMILDLLANGFKLPEGLVYEVADGISWFLQNNNGRKIWHLESGQEKFAYDRIACELAQQVDHDGPMHGAIARTEFNYLMSRGDTEAAIKALWEACGGTNES